MPLSTCEHTRAHLYDRVPCLSGSCDWARKCLRLARPILAFGSAEAFVIPLCSCLWRPLLWAFDFLSRGFWLHHCDHEVVEKCRRDACHDWNFLDPGDWSGRAPERLSPAHLQAVERQARRGLNLDHLVGCWALTFLVLASGMWARASWFQHFVCRATCAAPE